MASRRGFSLVELLVVISIVLVLATAAAWGLSGTRGADRAAAGARVLQSQLLGARDRASQAREPRGIRLLRDPTNARQLVGVALLQPAPLLRYGGAGAPFQLERDDTSPTDGRADHPEVLRVRGLATGFDWLELRRAGQLGVPFRIRYPAQTGRWHTVISLDEVPGHPEQTLARVFADLGAGDGLRDPLAVVAVPADSPRATCELDLGSAAALVQPGESLPAGLVIDLNHSRVPAEWLDGQTSPDLWAQPAGGLTAGSGGAAIWIALVLRDRRDADLGRDPADPTCVGPSVGLLIAPQTGRVQTFSLDLSDVLDNDTQTPGPDGRADDLFHLARAGAGGL
jgi:prepilin-type N-terminal cleavage/methylation domain-containing protein